MQASPRQFNMLARILHWTMAAMILTMLCIGVWMVVSLENYHVLLSIHRPLGIAILVLVAIRFVNRQLSVAPPFPPTMSSTEQRIAKASELAMYGLMFALPLVGWGMLSAARSPIVLFGSWQLPNILPQNLLLYAILRKTHTVLAYLFCFAILAHVSAILFHTFVLRDGMLNRMAPWSMNESKRMPNTAAMMSEAGLNESRPLSASSSPN
jgi:cytochrome b561